ncbi:MAG: SDR family NAD(P)-dependent oxidoreductase [Anaerolineae bacterium]|nr:SDR family NAD(P)-dependent oxidoreductase [Anaerolineae bacterium]
MASFDGKVVMVTGATGNLGQVVARRFAAQGAKLALVSRSADELKTLADELGAATMTEAADLGDPASVDALVGRVVARFGGIDVLAHTVGGYAAGKPVHESDVSVLDKVITLNVRPVYVTCGRVAKAMVERGAGGKIVVVLAKSALKGSAKNGAYSASKAAAQRIVESMALELRDLNINVNAVLPSTIDSPQNRADMPNADPSKWVTPDDVADAILFLASDAAAKIHGASLEVYGRS